MPPPIQVFLTTIASQPALRQRQGRKSFIASFEQLLIGYAFDCHRVHPTNIASEENTLYIV
jgi:hypothetical protein